MIPTVIIEETGPVGALLTAHHVRDLHHVRRILLQAYGSVEGEENDLREYSVPVLEIARLRGFLSERGVSAKGEVRRLLLMTLLELEDEDEVRRVVMPHAVLPKLLSPL